MARMSSQARGYESPGVDFNEKEVLPVIQGPNQLVVGIVGVAPRGPQGNTSIYNDTQLSEVFGDTFTKEFPALVAAKEILRSSDMIIFNRVVSENGHEGEVTDANNIFKFTTKTLDDSLNNHHIELKFDQESKLISYRLLTPDKSTVIEKSIGYTIGDPEAVSFIGELFNKKSSYLNLDIIGDLPSEETGFEELDLVIENGNSGLDVNAKDIVGSGNKGVKGFMSPDTVDIATLIVPGWSSDNEVINALEELTNYRGDVEVIIDPPANMSVTEVCDWTNGKGDIDHKLDNKWFAVYYPWISMNVNGKETLMPPSVQVAAQWAASDADTDCWFAPAGYGNGTGRGRGYLPSAIDVEVELSKEDRDKLYGNGNIINPVAKFIGKGIVLFGNRTTMRTNFGEAESAFCFLNVRRLCNFIRKLVISISFTELFNPNDSFTWNSWKLKIDNRLSAIKSARGIEEYRIVMDRTTISDDDIRAGRMPGIIYVKPIRAVEFIPISFVVTDNNIYFNEGQSFEVGPDSTLIEY